MMAKPSSRRKKATSAAEINSKSLSNSANEDISVEENPATATITVSAVEVEELTEEEQSDRLHLERRVERAVFEAGKALMELCDRRLYRSTHSTFGEYCKDRWEQRDFVRLGDKAAMPSAGAAIAKTYISV
jgi:hypothetical protein